MTAPPPSAEGTTPDPADPADPVRGRVRGRVRAFLAREVLPHADRWEDLGHIPPQGWRSLAEAGLLRLPHSGPGFLDSAVFLEELGHTGYAGIRSAVGVHAYMAPTYLVRFGTPEQRDRYLPAVRSGERIAALALSEAEAGTGLRDVTTTAEPDDAGGYRLTGRKAHVANGSRAGFFLVLARLLGASGGDRGENRGENRGRLAMLIVDAEAPGVTATPEPMLGYRTAGVCQVDFRAVPVPAGGLIGKAGHTLTYLMKALDFERLCAGLLAVGGAAHCIETTEAFVRTHQVNGEPLSTRQAVRHTIAELIAELDLVRRYAYHAASEHARGRLDTRTASILKLRATELGVSAARYCMQYHGARGYAEGSTVARIYRDAAAGTIAAGASELLRDLIFEARIPS